ncbi:MAG: hypothetical protein ABW123_11635 [Cystobacter sp.]
MISTLFAIGILGNGVCALVFLLNFAKPRPRRSFTQNDDGVVVTYRIVRHPASLVCAGQAVGWCVALAREMYWLPRSVTTPLISLGIPLGLLGALIVLNSRRQK